MAYKFVFGISLFLLSVTITVFGMSVSYSTPGAEIRGPYHIGDKVVFGVRSIHGSEVVASYKTEEFYSGYQRWVEFARLVSQKYRIVSPTDLFRLVEQYLTRGIDM